jgi:sugar phosphate isomerase/epimerase
MKTGKGADITRRRFLPLSLCGVVAATFARRTLSATPSLPVGIQLYTVGADMEKDPAGTLKKLATIGYNEVETAGFGKLSAEQFRGLVDDAGLRVPSAHLLFGMADTGKLLDDAKTLGAHYAVSSILAPRTPEGGVQGVLRLLNEMSVDDFKLAAAKANEIGQRAKAAGLQYAYHNHNFEFRDLGGGQRGYDILLRETDPALVKFEADCGWMRVAGADPIAYLTKDPGRFVMLHIKDFKDVVKPVTTLMAPDAPKPTELGRGSIDIKSVVRAGRKAGIRHMFVEQEPPFVEMTAMQAAAVDYDALHSVLV